MQFCSSLFCDLILINNFITKGNNFHWMHFLSCTHQCYWNWDELIEEIYDYVILIEIQLQSPNRQKHTNCFNKEYILEWGHNQQGVVFEIKIIDNRQVYHLLNNPHSTKSNYIIRIPNNVRWTIIRGKLCY